MPHLPYIVVAIDDVYAYFSGFIDMKVVAVVEHLAVRADILDSHSTAVVVRGAVEADVIAVGSSFGKDVVERLAVGMAVARRGVRTATTCEDG